jgi:hypothetical protein
MGFTSSSPFIHLPKPGWMIAGSGQVVGRRISDWERVRNRIRCRQGEHYFLGNRKNGQPNSGPNQIRLPSLPGLSSSGGDEEGRLQREFPLRRKGSLASNGMARAGPEQGEEIHFHYIAIPGSAKMGLGGRRFRGVRGGFPRSDGRDLSLLQAFSRETSASACRMTRIGQALFLTSFAIKGYMLTTKTQRH